MAARREDLSPQEEQRGREHEASYESWKRHSEDENFRGRVAAKLAELAAQQQPSTLTREQFLEATADYSD